MLASLTFQDLVAHGVGSRQDLPIPFAYAMLGAVVALLFSFVVVSWRWPEPRLRGGTAGRALPVPVARLFEAPAWQWTWRALMLVCIGYVAIAAIGGPDDALNPTAGSVYVLFWVGIVAITSALLGPVWRLLNPIRTLQLLLFRQLGRDPQVGVFGSYPARLGYWPGALAVLSFVWLELVGPNRASTFTLMWWIGTYSAVQFLGAVLFGSRWLTRADGFEVVSSLFGRLSCLGRRDDRTWVLRSPLAGLDQLPVEAGLTAVVSVMLGSTAYDGLTQGIWWLNVQQDSSLSKVATGTLGLLAMVAIIAVTFTGASWLAGGLGHPLASRWSLPDRFAPSVVPIALGYVLAHYWSLFILVGQQTLVQLSDPLGTGANWLGSADRGISYAWVGALTVATLQVIFVVGGHITGVLISHDRAVALFPRRTAVIGQLPLLVVMVAYTLVGLTLLFTS